MERVRHRKTICVKELLIRVRPPVFFLIQEMMLSSPSLLRIKTKDYLGSPVSF